MVEKLETLLNQVAAEVSGASAEALQALAEHMMTGGTDRHGPVRDIFATLGDRWSTLILLVLRTGEYRHALLRRIMDVLGHEEGVSQRMLTLKLRGLERNGLVRRAVTDDVPPHVSYALTPLAQNLLAHVWGLIGWIIDNRATIEAARQDYDLRQEDAW